jgi:hypothetical protein
MRSALVNGLKDDPSESALAGEDIITHQFKRLIVRSRDVDSGVNIQRNAVERKVGERWRKED